MSFSGFIRNDKNTAFTHFPKPGSESEAVFSEPGSNSRSYGSEVDAQSGLSRPQQMASLKGAVYGIYAKRSDYIGRWRWRDSL